MFRLMNCLVTLFHEFTYLTFFLKPFKATRVTASKMSERVKELLNENTILQGKSGFWEEFEVKTIFHVFLVLGLIRCSEVQIVYPVSI